MGWFTISLKLHLLTAIKLNDGQSRGFFQNNLTRNARGELVIHGSAIKGRLRAECDAFQQRVGGRISQMEATQTVVRRLFGDADEKGLLFFEDLVLENPTDSGTMPTNTPKWDPKEKRAGILINRFLGSVEHQHLFHYETVPAGLSFSGEIEGKIPSKDAEHLETYLTFIDAGLRMITHLGGSVSRGLGRVQIDLTGLDFDDIDPPLNLKHRFLRGDLPVDWIRKHREGAKP